MSEQKQTEGTVDTSTGNPAPQQQAPAPQPSEFKIPEGKRLVDASEWDQISRQAQNYKGAAPMIQKMVESGYKSPDDLDNLLQSHQKWSSLGADPDQLLAALGKGPKKQEQVESEQPQAFDMKQIEQLLDQRIQNYSVTQQHQSAERQQSEMAASLIKELAGENASEETQYLAKAAVMQALQDEARFYDEGHPLADRHYRPHDKDSFAQVSESVRAKWKALRGAKVAENAKRGTPSPGQSAVSGDGPAAPKNDGKQNSPFDRQDRQSKEAQAAAILARLTGGQMSQSGG